MRRFALIVVAALSGCMLRQTAGEQTVSFSVPHPPDTLLARARTELGTLGYAVTPTAERVVITTPRPVPDSLAGLSPDSVPLTGQMWVLRVTAAQQTNAGGSRGTVSAFLFSASPRRDSTTTGNVVFERATPVTRTLTPGLFTEVQRVAERIQAAAVRPPNHVAPTNQVAPAPAQPYPPPE